MRKETVVQISKKLRSCELEALPLLLKRYEEDRRKGVQELLIKHKRLLESSLKERDRLIKMYEFEEMYQEYPYVCGIDEAGRGPLAGPVVAAAVILSKGSRIPDINDSKQLSEAKRNELYPIIMEQAISYGVGVISSAVIDEVNILQATYLAMKKAVEELDIKPDILLNDAVTIPGLSYKQVNIVKGDERSISIAAASIIAKVTRDRMMREYDTLYPEYSFVKNKGYGSKKHIEILKEIGPCPIHRKSFIKKFCEIKE